MDKMKLYNYELLTRGGANLEQMCLERTMPHAGNSIFSKWRVEEVLFRSIFIIIFVGSRQVEASKQPIANLKIVSTYFLNYNETI